MNTIRVFVLDGGEGGRSPLVPFLGSLHDITVVGEAGDGVSAHAALAAARAEVVVLALAAPRVDGIAFLRRLMAERPLPVVVLYGDGSGGTGLALRAMAEGAAAMVARPAGAPSGWSSGQRARLAEAVRRAAKGGFSAWVRPHQGFQVPPRLAADAVLPCSAPPASPAAAPLVAVASSTGGPQALERLLTALPAESPGVVIVQHMPAGFTASLAKRLDELCRIEVKEAADGDAVRPGLALIAPGDRHLAVRRSGGGYVARLIDGPPVSRHRPSADVLFRSVAQEAGRSALGLILTGMGDDGVAGLLEMRAAGAATIAQDAASSVVYGMPRAAVERGAAERVAALGRMAEEIGRFAAAARSRAPLAGFAPPPYPDRLPRSALV